MTLIKNATIVTSEKSFLGDLLIEDGKIAKIANSIESTDSDVIEAEGKILFPGGVDVHTHMELPVSGTQSSDSFETGTKAALMGGTTTIIDFANQTKGESPLKAIEIWKEKAGGNCYIDYAFHIAITDLTENIEEEIDAIINEHGITSFKTFLAYPAMELQLEDLDRLMAMVRKRGGIVTNHAEVGRMISERMEKATDLSPKSHPWCHPEKAETEAVKHLIRLAIKNQCPTYLVHTSTKKAGKLMSRAKRKFSKLYIETCPQYLTLTDELYSLPFEESAKYVMSPPLRKKGDVQGLWKLLTKGKVDTVATDHCPFKMEQKRVGSEDFKLIPNGAPGVEDRFMLTYHQMINERNLDLSHFARIIATNPANIFGLGDRKGDIKEGLDADLVLIDPFETQTISAETHHMNVDYNLYEGTDICGKIGMVWSKGVKDGEIQKGDGNYLKRKAL